MCRTPALLPLVLAYPAPRLALGLLGLIPLLYVPAPKEDQGLTSLPLQAEASPRQH
ncbi:hypothetical protein [Hymenobacter terrenus]|uniref:hypothetical protein n=1 Tax=Hymenobacter terrenus TaxID=1629124 RepID=UPI000AD0FD09|nr:hypothetical protein [Hymenobacter terrenus]